jgi:hypothetical protein
MSSSAGDTSFAPPMMNKVRVKMIGYQLDAALHMTWDELLACVAAGYNRFTLRFSDGAVQQVTLQANARGTRVQGELGGSTPTRVILRKTRRGPALQVRNWCERDLHWAGYTLAACTQ